MQLYICAIQEFMHLNGLNLITEKRRARVNAYMRSEDKARCLVSGLLLRRICGIVDDRQLTYSKNGKPYLKNEKKYFTISHSGNYVVLAIANREIGVDIEKTTHYSDAVARRCFTPLECEWMHHQGSNEAFYYLWTAKESVMKASGLGFSLLPETFHVLPINASAHYIAGKTWFLDWHVYDDHVICLTIEDKAEKTEIIPLMSNDLLDMY